MDYAYIEFRLKNILPTPIYYFYHAGMTAGIVHKTRQENRKGGLASRPKSNNASFTGTGRILSIIHAM
jgi:hypothetical protein